MSEQESNVCEICGGVKRIEYVIGFEEGRPRDMRVESPSLLEGEWRLCPGHPEPAQKHDGRLDEDYQVYQSNGAWGVEGMILEYKGTCRAIIRPAQALSLLAWLEQNREELRRLAKEQAE